MIPGITLWMVGLISLAIFKGNNNHFQHRPIVQPQSINSGSIKLFKRPNNIILSKGRTTVVISHDSTKRINKMTTPFAPNGVSCQEFDAVYGIFDLPLCSYIVMVKSSTPISNGIAPEGIRRVESFEFIKIPLSDSNISQSVENVEQHRLAKAQFLEVLEKQNFHFSTTAYDITRSFQSNSVSMNCKHEERFFWNYNAVREFLLVNATDLVTPMCSAWIESHIFPLPHGQSVNFHVIARRAKSMQGARYVRRGGDKDGNVANFVEIEQILLRLDGTRNSSFLQVRGSIPLKWKQSRTWMLKPPVELLPDTSIQRNFVINHYQSLATQYGLLQSPAISSILAINLIDKKGGQGILGMIWRRLMRQIDSSNESDDSLREAITNHSKSSDHDQIKLDRDEINSEDFMMNGCKNSLIWFDYHHHCHGTNVKAIEKLYSYIAKVIQYDGLYVQLEGSLVSNQRRLIRVNCMDCLDRTNVVQASISRWVLIRQLKLLAPTYRAAMTPNSMQLLDNNHEEWFRSCWTDLGDFISKLYAGSRAMKRDVTKTGVRTGRGLVDDAFSFAQRYVSNNLIDPSYQRRIDFMLGDQQIPGAGIQEEIAQSNISSQIVSNIIGEDKTVMLRYLDDFMQK